MLPNERKRFCTEQLKLFPIFWHCYLNYFDNSPFLMNIGFRWDEPRRVEGWTCDRDKFKFPASCSLLGRKQWQYKTEEWRISHFPMYEDRIGKLDVNKFWDDKGWEFPSISNCDFCFHHRPIQQQIQAKMYPERAQWWIEMEEKVQASFGKLPLKSILSQEVLDIFDDSDQSMCHCTD